MRLSYGFVLFLFAGFAQAGEPEHGTILTLTHEGADYAAQFWTGSDKIIIGSLPEAAARDFPAPIASIVAARALEHFDMNCSLGAPGPFYGLPGAYEVPYTC